MSLLILDYGMGNLRSVQKAFEYLGHEATVTTDIRAAGRLVIPGVGAFGQAMENLAPFRDQIRDHVEAGKPLLGICLGQQLLFESSEEHGAHEGLAMLPGTVKYFPKEQGRKVPMIGWAPLDIVRPDGLMTGVHQSAKVYFVHSLYVECAPELVTARATYGLTYAAAVRQGNVHAVQFHPEKSGRTGLKMLANFLSCT